MAYRVVSRASALRARLAAAALATLLGVVAAAAPSARAQDAEGSAEERQACTPDVFSLCSSAIPDAQQVRACLARRVDELSPGCREVFDRRARAQLGRKG